MCSTYYLLYVAGNNAGISSKYALHQGTWHGEVPPRGESKSAALPVSGITSGLSQGGGGVLNGAR